MRTTLPHTEPFTTVSSALFNHLCEHISSTRLHQEQSHLLQQDTNQDVSDTAGNLSELLHHIPAFCFMHIEFDHIFDPTILKWAI